MPKHTESFACSDCGNETPRWAGQCPSCGSWNTLVSVTGIRGKSNTFSRIPASPITKQRLSDITSLEHQRISSGFSEFDRVLGGGFIAGEVVLLSGEPGVGKSTLLLQTAAHLSSHAPVVYAAGEESPHQIRHRADRLGVHSDSLYVHTPCTVQSILASVESLDSQVVIVDSVQTLLDETLEGQAGSVMQVRDGTAALVKHAKERGYVLILVGHITKEGSIAGPKMLEHMVDCVVYLEGDEMHEVRILRVLKNRFGSVSEVGVFQMKEKGMVEVGNPSALFLDARSEGTPGSCVTAVTQGGRIFLLEVQALVVPTSFNYPRRTVVGVELNRVLMVLAIVQKSVGLDLSHHDVFVSIGGGMKVQDVAADSAIAAALISSARQKALSASLCVFGELGLTGRVRTVSLQESRSAEALRFGYAKCISPATASSLGEIQKELFSH